MKSLGFTTCIHDIATRELLIIPLVLPTHINTIFIKHMVDSQTKLKGAAPFVINSMSV